MKRKGKQANNKRVHLKKKRKKTKKKTRIK